MVLDAALLQQRSAEQASNGLGQWLPDILDGWDICQFFRLDGFMLDKRPQSNLQRKTSRKKCCQ